MIKSVHIYIPLYFFVFYLFTLVLYMNGVDKLLCFLSLESFPEKIFRGKDGDWKVSSVFLEQTLKAEAAPDALGSLCLSTIINPEDSCCFAATQSARSIRESALFCSFLLQKVKKNLCAKVFLWQGLQPRP